MCFVFPCHSVLLPMSLGLHIPEHRLYYYLHNFAAFVPLPFGVYQLYVQCVHIFTALSFTPLVFTERKINTYCPISTISLAAHRRFVTLRKSAPYRNSLTYLHFIQSPKYFFGSCRSRKWYQDKGQRWYSSVRTEQLRCVKLAFAVAFVTRLRIVLNLHHWNLYKLTVNLYQHGVTPKQDFI